MNDRCDEVLVALRRLIRAVGLHSRQLERTHGLTAPQALVLNAVAAKGQGSVGDVAAQVSLSQATVTDILNRLERRGLLTRVRSDRDRRRVLVRPTHEGIEIMESSPPLLQEAFVERFSALEDWEQTQLLASLQRVAALMGAADLDAAPLLAAGAVGSGEEAGASTERSARALAE